MRKTEVKAYAIISDLDLGYGDALPIIRGFFSDKATAKRALSMMSFKGRVQAITPTDYTIKIYFHIGDTPLICAGGNGSYKNAEKGKRAFETLYPTLHFEILKFNETSLFKNHLNECQTGGIYA